MGSHERVERTVRDGLVFGFGFSTCMHIQDLKSLISFNNKLATCEGYCEENGGQISVA